MAPTQRTNPEHKATKPKQGVAKPKKDETHVQVEQKWKRLDDNVKRAEAKKEGDDVLLQRLNEEIAELETRDESQEKKILLANALARRDTVEERLGIAMAVDSQDKDDEENEDSEGGEDGKTIETSEKDVLDSIEKKILNNIPWYIRDKSPEDLTKDGEQSIPIGYRKKGSGRLYLVRYGNSRGCSTCFESSPPTLAEHPDQSLQDVACKKNRIIENIIQWHKDHGKPLPDEVLSKAQILNVYWDSKSKLGSEVGTDIDRVLGPKPELRTSVRCVVYLDPELYVGKGWGITNEEGLSHETRTTMLSCISGISREAREIELYDIAVRLENRYRRVFQPDQHILLPYDRPSSVPLQKFRPSPPRRLRTVQPETIEDPLEEFTASQRKNYGDITARKRYQSEGLQQQKSVLTEQSMERIMERFMTGFEARMMRKLKEELVDEVTEKVLARLNQEK